MSTERIDLGHGFSYSFFSWSPDRELNPQYEGVADVEHAGVILFFKDPADASDAEPYSVGGPWFDTPETRAIPGFPKRNFWTLVSEEPLHLEPSIQTYAYVEGEHVPEHHGFIREGRWVPA